jgi:hypothetical protein
MSSDDQRLLDFVGPQIQECGGKVEIESGLWVLFAVPAADTEANAIARSLLDGARFAHHVGESADDQWTLYYVDTANRPAAVHWLEDLSKVLAGQIRPPAPATLALIDELIGSDMPHRIAQRLVEMHSRDEISAGIINDPAAVRALLDRLHAREPLFFSAFQSLLANHLVNMAVLLQQMIDEDVGLGNEIVKGSLSQDPFFQSRQNAAANIRTLLLRYHVINPLDQQKNAATTNPYAAFMDIDHGGDQITAQVDGNKVILPRSNFLTAIHAIRRNLYRGEPFESFNTRAPWVNDEIAYSFRFIKQRLEARRDLSAMDGLFMLERAVDT